RLDFFHQSPVFYLASLTLTQVPLRQQSIPFVAWSLCYEVAFYAVVLLVGLVARNRMLAVLHLVTIGSLIALATAPELVPFPFNLWPQFGIGVVVYDLLSNP